MPSDPRSHARAALLVGAMSFEPQPLVPLQIVPPAVRRVMPRIAPPLDLRVNPIRYRMHEGSIEPVPPRCGHGHTHSRARGRRQKAVTE